MIKVTLWDQISEQLRCSETRQNQRIASNSVRGHISEHIHALRIEARALPTGERRAQLLEEINDLYDLFCEIGT